MDTAARLARMEPEARMALADFATEHGCTVEDVVAHEDELFGMPVEQLFAQALAMDLPEEGRSN